MSYRAVCPCPMCGSRATTLGPPDARGIRRWGCASCGRQFEPPDESCGQPVLACSGCGDFTTHSFDRVVARRWRGGDLCRTVAVDVYSCRTCGTSREYGFAPSSLSVVRQPEAA